MGQQWTTAELDATEADARDTIPCLPSWSEPEIAATLADALGVYTVLIPGHGDVPVIETTGVEVAA